MARKGKKSGIASALTNIGLIAGGAVLGKVSEGLTGKVKNPMLRDGAKVAAGIAPHILKVKSDTLKMIMTGVGVQGAYSLASNFVPSLLPAPTTQGERGVLGVGATIDEMDYLAAEYDQMNGTDYDSRLAQEDIIGATQEEVIGGHGGTF